MGILGESVTLPLTLSASHAGENVIWMFNTSIISKERRAAATADPLTKFKDANMNSSQDYSLMIGRLKMENAGHYHAYVCSQASGVISTKHITLHVYGEFLSRVLVITFLPWDVSPSSLLLSLPPQIPQITSTAFESRQVNSPEGKFPASSWAGTACQVPLLLSSRLASATQPAVLVPVLHCLSGGSQSSSTRIFIEEYPCR